MVSVELLRTERASAVEQSRAVCVAEGVVHDYGEHRALAGVDYSAAAGQISALLGPNGSGKTTLFRLICTLMPVQQGRITIAEIDAASDPLAVRRQIGIVFQSASLDVQLTVAENLACQGALYGLSGRTLRGRIDELLQRFELGERRSELCKSLSGGLKRRVELAKGMLHRPRLMLLDEPSTGLDPSARQQLWSLLRTMADEGVAVVLTTHLLEEAEKADRVAILSGGRKIADGTPHGLRSELGGGIVTIVTAEPEAIEAALRDEFGLDPRRIENQLRLESDVAAPLVARLTERFSGRIESITVGRPSLEDVFIAKTGREFE